jgi:ABC-2 type transport system ATP-binding protein
MIEIKDLSKSFGKNKAVDVSSLKIQPDSITALVGVNGSGKSTLMRLMAGVYKKDQGQILYDGKEVYENPEVKKDILFISDNPLSSRSNSISSLEDFYSFFYQMDRKKFKEEIERFSLPKDGNLSTFSKGMKRRVYIAIALSVAPKVLLLDEAFDGIDPEGRSLFKKELISLMDEKEMTIVVSSHSLRELEELADRYILMKKGQIVFDTEQKKENDFHKFTLGFTSKVEKEKLSIPELVRIEGKDKLYTFVSKAKKEEIEKALEKLHPVLLEETEMTLEDMFISDNEEGRVP